MRNESNGLEAFLEERDGEREERIFTTGSFLPETKARSGGTNGDCGVARRKGRRRRERKKSAWVIESLIAIVQWDVCGARVNKLARSYLTLSTNGAFDTTTLYTTPFVACNRRCEWRIAYLYERTRG